MPRPYLGVVVTIPDNQGIPTASHRVPSPPVNCPNPSPIPVPTPSAPLPFPLLRPLPCHPLLSPQYPRPHSGPVHNHFSEYPAKHCVVSFSSLLFLLYFIKGKEELQSAKAEHCPFYEDACLPPRRYEPIACPRRKSPTQSINYKAPIQFALLRPPRAIQLHGKNAERCQFPQNFTFRCLRSIGAAEF